MQLQKLSHTLSCWINITVNKRKHHGPASLLVAINHSTHMGQLPLWMICAITHMPLCMVDDFVQLLPLVYYELNSYDHCLFSCLQTTV